MADIAQICKKVDCEFLRIDAEFYYEHHCYDGKSGFTIKGETLWKPASYNEVDEIGKLESSQKFWAKYMTLGDWVKKKLFYLESKDFKEYFPATKLSKPYMMTRDKWDELFILLLKDPECPVKFDGFHIHMQAHDYAYTPDQLIKFNFFSDTAVHFPSKEARQVEEYINKKLREIGVKLENGAKFRFRAEDAKYNLSNPYTLEIPKGTCKQPVNPPIASLCLP